MVQEDTKAKLQVNKKKGSRTIAGNGNSGDKSQVLINNAMNSSVLYSVHSTGGMVVTLWIQIPS